MAAETVDPTTPVVAPSGDEAKPVDIELEGKIIDQIEYYFGDINLGRDKFLKEEIQKDDGWIPLEILVKFNRMEKLTKETSVVAEALKKSDLMEVSEDGTKIRRSVDRPLRNYTKEELAAKSVYAKGFPADVTLDQVKEFFKAFGDTDNIQMRKDFRKRFKGSCFVIFRTDELAKKFVETPDIKYNDTDMIRLFKEDYFKKKSDERKQKSADKPKRSEESQKEKEEKLEKEAQEEKEKLKEKMTPGAVLNVEGIPKGTKREELKTFFMKFGSVGWVDFETGHSKGRVRFGAKDEAKTALEKAKEENDGKVMMGEAELECRLLEGDEELDHWKAVYKAKQDRQTFTKDRKFKRRGGGDRRGGPHKKRGRHSRADKESSDGDQDDDGGDDDE